MFIIPIEKDHPVRRRPWLVYFLIVINTLVFLYTYFITDHQMVVHQYGFIPTRPDLTTIVTSAFLHSGFLHIIGNMFFLYMFGDNVEDVLGKILSLISYSICIFGAIGFHYLFNTTSNMPCVGASGAISGVVGLYVVLFPYAHVGIVFYLRHWTISEFHTNAKGAIIAWFILQAILGFISVMFSDSPIFRVAFWAHVGGLVSGFTLGFLYRLIGIKIPIPCKTVEIERKQDGSFWCPHCGKKHPFLEFGKYKCQVCGTSYHFKQEAEE